jgi:hypothetical protein
LRPFVAATLVALIAAGLAVEVLSGAGLARGPKIRAVRPKADAFVSQASRTQNFGQARFLKVDSSPVVRTYVTFRVHLDDNVRHVSLLLYSRTRSQRGYRIRLTNERFRERLITFANAPKLSGKFVSSGPLRADAWKAVDVTTLASGKESYVGFVLTSVSAKGLEFASRETGLRGPRLIVERRGNETTGSTGTSTGAQELP